jgi:hypothetical protein
MFFACNVGGPFGHIGTVAVTHFERETIMRVTLLYVTGFYSHQRMTSLTSLLFDPLYSNKVLFASHRSLRTQIILPSSW